MAVFGRENFTSFSAINLKGSVALRVGGLDTFAGTLAIKGGSLDGARDWHFPDKSGTFATSGTVSVQLASALGNSVWHSTTVTVAGITVEDGITFNLAERGTYTYGEQGTKYIFIGAKPTAGGITLSFYNLGNGTGYIDLVGNYTAVR